MVDVNAFFDPTGGKNYGQTINSGLTGLILGFGTDIVSSKIVSPLIRRHEKAGREALRYRAQVASRRGLEHAAHSTAQGWHGRARVQREVAGDAARTAVNRMRPHIQGVVRGKTAGLRSAKSLLHGVSWMMITSALFEMGEAAFTPGISKLASAQDAKLFNNAMPSDSPTAYTMRSRALEAIYNSQSSLRNVIGNEAGYLHS